MTTQQTSALVINPAMDAVITAESDNVLLKDRQTGRLKLIGKREWSILKAMADDQLDTLYQSYRPEFIDKVIAKGLEMTILVPAGAAGQAETSPETFVGKLRRTLDQITGGIVHLDFQGNFSLFRVLTLRLRTGNAFESLRFSTVVGSYGLFLTMLVILNYLTTNTLTDTFFSVTALVTYPITLFVGLAFFSSYLFSAFHEMGHYVLYKSLGGKSNIIGMGLKFLVMPVLYVNTDTVYLWKQRWKRVLVSLGGSVVDATIGLLFITFIKYQYSGYPNVAFFGYMVLISTAIKIFFNLNFFMPGTDGYFILTDLLGKNNYYKTVETDKNRLVRAVRERDWLTLRRFTRGTWLNIGYFGLAFLFKCTSIFLTLWSFLFIGRMLFTN